MARGKGYTSMTNPNQLTLEEKCMAYWKMSSCWNNRPESPAYTVQDVISISNKIIKQTDPNRRVTQRVFALVSELINRPPKTRKKKKPETQVTTVQSAPNTKNN